MTLFVILVIGFASFVQVSFGFGGGLLAVPLLSLVMTPHDAVLLFLIFQSMKIVFLPFIMKDINLDLLRTIIIPLIIGVMIGTMALNYVPMDLFRVLLGLYILWFVFKDKIAFFKLRNITISPWIAPTLMGSFFGFVQGLVGMGGPVVASYLRGFNLTNTQFRATVTGALLIANFGRILFEWRDIFASSVIQTYLLPGILAFIVAVFAGSVVPKTIPRHLFALCIDALLCVSALVLLASTMKDMI